MKKTQTVSRKKLALLPLEDRSVPSITGTLFQDFNGNGAMDTTASISNNGTGSIAAAVDRGVEGVTVTAFNANNQVVGTALSDALGKYTLNTTGNGPFRVEFTGLPTGVYFGPQGTANNSAIQFVASNSAINVNLSLMRPEDFAPNNPTLATSVYVIGGTTNQDLNPGAAVVVSFPGSSGSADGDPNRNNHQDPTQRDLSVAQRDVGTTWGLAYDQNSNMLYASAFMKRTTAFGPGGAGAIYQMGVYGSASSIYADLNSIFPDMPAGNLANLYTDINGQPVSFRQNITDPNYWFTDGLSRFTDNTGVVRELGWDVVGKIAMGGLDVNADGTKLYTMALGDRRLYVLPTSGTLNSTTVKRFDIPVPSSVTGRTASNPLGDLRPFAVEEHRGIIYIGAVNSAESTGNANDLMAYVFAFDPTTGTFVDASRRATTTTPIFQMALNYERGQVHQGHDPIPGGFSGIDPAEWNAWSPVHRTVQDPNAFVGRSSYPQPMLTGLSFDSDGNMVLGFRDRSGDQFGRNVPIDPDRPNEYSSFSITAGDVLRAGINQAGNLNRVQNNPGTPFSGWTLESNGRVNGMGNGAVSNGQGPGGAEFYYDDDFPRDPSTVPVGEDVENDEVSMGAVLQIPGTNQLLATSFDPVRVVGAINGGGIRWYDNTTGGIVKSYELYVTPSNTNTTTFAKGNGLGDLAVIGNPPPIEIGNFVWLDNNRNGIQDAGESGLANVAIGLYNANGDLVATAVTDANGHYIFSSGAGTSTTSRVFNLALTANTDYQLRVNRTQSSLGGRSFTLTTNDASTNGTARDSNVNADGVANVRTSLVGRADHSIDIGVAATPSLALGDTVWNDLNNDGRKQDNEPGVDNVTVYLYAADGTTLLAMQQTKSGGQYLFTGLAAGQYVVEVVPPAGFVSSTGVNNLFEPGTTSEENNADHGTQSGSRIRSGTVTLNDTNIDGSQYLRVDFGLIRPLSIGNLVFEDLNNNGIRDGGERGLGNIAVTLRTSTGGFVASTITNSLGGYLFRNLIPGNYVVEIEKAALPGYYSSTGANSISSGDFEPARGTSVDSTDYGTSVGSVFRGPVVVLNYDTQPRGEAPTEGGLIDNAADENSNLRQDFGFFRTLSLGNQVWFDTNNDGVRQGTEKNAADVEVRLYNDKGQTLATTRTNNEGIYLFETLFPGNYVVEIVPPSGYESSTGERGQFEPATLSTRDNEDKGTADAALRTIRSGVVTLSTYGSSSNPSLGGFGNLTIDFGLIQEEIVVPPPPPPPAVVPSSVSGFVYRDIWNTNGQRETAQGETGIAGTRVTITGTQLNGDPFTPRTAFTTSTGFYEFTNLLPGTYTITETQPRGFYDGIDTIGSLGGGKPGNDVLTVTLGEDQHGIEYNFGEVLGAAVFGYVYEDVNRNRRFDAGEPPIPGTIVTISGTAWAGTPMATPLTAAMSLNGLTTRTDSNGRWEFPLLPAGNYTIVETQPANYQDFFESVQEPRIRPVTVGNDVFDTVTLAYNETRGPLNYGEVRAPGAPTKQNFLGGSGNGTVDPSTTPPVSVDPGEVNLTPAFGTSSTEPAFVVLSAASGRSPLLRVLDYQTGTERFKFFAYEEAYTGGVRVATGDVDGDGVPDIIAATGQGGGPRVRVFSGLDGGILKDFFAYEPEFRGGVFVAAADVNGDGKADIITGTELGGGPRMTVFDVANGGRIHDFFAFDSNQRGGIRVSAADFNGDGKADLVATAGRGTTTRVRVFDAVTRTLLSDVVPYDLKFTGGVFIAAGDVTGDGIADIITSADVGGGPHVQVFDGLSGRSVNSFFADSADFRGGIRLAVQDVDGDGIGEIVTATGPGGNNRVRMWKLVKSGSSISYQPIEDFSAFDAAYQGGVYVG